MKTCGLVGLFTTVLLFAGVLVRGGETPATKPTPSSVPGTLLVQDADHPEILANAEDNGTGLRLTVSLDKPLTKGQECQVRVEIENTSCRVEVVYMPGLTMRPTFTPTPTKQALRPDEYGLPMIYGRLRAKDERLNYVVLTGGDVYGRNYAWTPPAIGAVKFAATYENAHDGRELNVKSWRGKLRAQSKSLTIGQR